MKQAEPFRVWTRPLNDDVVMVELGGEVDVLTAPRLQQAIDGAIKGSPKGVVVNLTQVPFIDGSGLDVLRIAAARLARNSGRLVLLNLDPRVDRVLRLTGLHRLLPVCHAEDEAWRAASA